MGGGIDINQNLHIFSLSETPQCEYFVIVQNIQ